MIARLDAPRDELPARGARGGAAQKEDAQRRVRVHDDADAAVAFHARDTIFQTIKGSRRGLRGVASWSFPRERGVDLSGPGAALRDARAVAVVSSLVVVWALSGALVPLLARFTSVQVVLAALPALVGGAALMTLRPRAAQTAGGVLLTLAIAMLIGGHAAGPRGAEVATLLAPGAFVALGAPLVVAVVVTTVILALVPLWAGARVHAIARTIDATGARARSLRLDVLSLPARHADDLGEPLGVGRWVAGTLARLAEGYHFAGRVVVEGIGALRRTRGRRDIMHVDVAPDDVLARLPENSVTVRRTRIRWPAVAADALLEIEGERDDVMRARRVVLDELAHESVFAWSQQARRWELRLNALLAEARDAQSVEERGILLEEAERLLAVLERRQLCQEEWALLVAWKGQRLRQQLSAAMLNAQPGAKRQDRAAAPAPAMAPDIAHLMRAGGLDAMQRVAFQPMWVLPAWSPWGEREVIVDARTGRHHPDESRALLDAMRERAPSPFVDVARRAQFHPAPAPTAAILRALRETLPPGLRAEPTAAEAPVETVYVPVVASDHGLVNVVTGAAPAAEPTVAAT